MDNEKLEIIIDGNFVYEQVHFCELKPNAVFYLACPTLDKGHNHVLPCYPRTNPQAEDAIVWTVYNKFEFNRGYNPWVVRKTEKSLKNLSGLINSKSSDWF